MSTEASDPLLKDRWKFTVAVGWAGYVVSLLIILGILGSAAAIWIGGGEVPKQLADWGTVCIGFLALLISQARDIIKLGQGG